MSRNGLGFEQNLNPHPLSDAAGSPVLTWDGVISHPATHSPLPSQHGQDLHWGGVMRPHLNKSSFQAIPEPTLAEWKTFSSGTEEPVVLAGSIFVFFATGIFMYSCVVLMLY